MSLLAFTAIGHQLPILVKGVFPDGSQLDITHSTRTHYSSSDVRIATVDGNGMVTAAGPGQATILIQSGARPHAQYGAILVQVAQLPPTGNPPVITAAFPTAGIPGVTQVTITGHGFGAQGSGVLLLGSRNASLIDSWTDTKIVATVPAGSQNGDIEVGQGGLYSNDIHFSITTPIIGSLDPTTVTAGAHMTITGSGFGETQESGFVTTNNTRGVVVSWNDKQIVISIAPGTTPGQVRVSQKGYESNGVYFTTPK